MSNFELNKIFAAIILAALIAMIAGFISRLVISPEMLADNIYKPEMQEDMSESKNVAAKPAGPEPIESLLASADIARGEKLFRACAVCHTSEKGGANKVGPNLWNIVGDEQGKGRNFNFSKALASLDGHWTYANLNKFIAKPKAYAPGTKMSYAGMKKTKDRADLIAWLRTLSDDPQPLP